MRTDRSLAVSRGGVSAWGVSAQGGVPCDLSHHAFDVTCMLSLLQLILKSNAAAYFVVVMLGYTPPIDRILDTCLWKHYFPATTVVGGNNVKLNLKP